MNETKKEEAKADVLTPSPIEKAEELVKKLEELDKKYQDVMKKNQEIEARMILGGKSTIAQPVPVEKPLTDIEFANKFRRGEINPFGNVRTI